MKNKVLLISLKVLLGGGHKAVGWNMWGQCDAGD
jgi:hypothetical protein